MTGKLYKTTKGWFVETKNNEIIPVHPKSELDEMNSGNKVDFDIVEEDNNGMGYTETYEIIKITSFSAIKPRGSRKGQKYLNAV